MALTHSSWICAQLGDSKKPGDFHFQLGAFFGERSATSVIPVFLWSSSARVMHCGRAASKKKAGCLCFRRGTAATTVKMGSLRELQHALQEKNTEMKMKDSRILSLEQELKRRNEIIRRLESELDKYRSVLQPAVATRTRNQRQGISAEPQSYKTVTDASKPLQRHNKSSRQALLYSVTLLLS